MGMSRFATPDRTTINANSPLQPFYTSSGSFHTSNSVRSIRGFGYTYTGLEYWQKSDAQMKTDATALINSLYGTGVSGPRKRQEAGAGETTRYFVQVSVDVEQLDRPCSINVYVKDQSVGRIIVMKQPQAGTVNGELPLDKATNTIQPQMDVAKAPKAVVPALLTDLRVEILKVSLFPSNDVYLEKLTVDTQHDGSVIPLAEITSLKLNLVNVTVTPPSSDAQLPKYGNAEKRPAPKKQKGTGRRS